MIKCYYCECEIEQYEKYFNLPDRVICKCCLEDYQEINDDSDYLYDIYEDDRLIELEKESD